MRLRTLPLSLAGVLAGSAVVTQKETGFVLIFLFAVLTTVLLQILSNLANDYGDFQNGADNEGRIGPARAVQSGVITPEKMRLAIIVNAIMALLAGIALIWTSFGARGEWVQFGVFFLIGLGAIAAAVRYTAGPNPYGYRGLGDISVMLFFGIVSVAGTFYLHEGDFTLKVLLPALSIGAFSTAVLNLNNMRDHLNDAQTGKRTLVVAMGYNKAKIYHITLIVSGWAMLGIFLLLFAQSQFMWFALAPLIIHLAHIKKVLGNSDPQALDPELKKVAISTFLIALILFVTSFF